MATAYTSLLGFALPVTGELNGTWGDVVNNSITSLVESSIAGSATASVTSGDWTLTTTGSGVANQARNAILIPTGTPGVSRNIIAPSSSKAFIVVNQSNAAVIVKGSATTGATIVAGTNALVAWNGSDFALVAQNIENVTGTLPVTKGGTGLTSVTASRIPYGAGTSALNTSASLTFDGTILAAPTATVTTANATTVDTTNIEVTNLKAKDGTAAGSIADATGIVTIASTVLTTTDINGGTVDGTTIGATTPSTIVATQVNITAQGDLRLQDTTGGEYVALQAPATVSTSYTLTLPDTDGDAGQALITDGSGVLSWSSAAAGDVYGPASATDNAVARFDGATGKIIQNSVVTIADTTGDISGVGQLNATTLDATNLEVTNLKAKDGTAAGSIANSTGIVTLASSVLTTADINGGTVDGTVIGGASAAAITGTNLAYTGTLTGSTGIINIGSGQVYKDASGNVGIGTSSPNSRLDVRGNALIGTGIDDGGRVTISGASGFAGTGLSLIENSTGNGRRLRLSQETTGSVYNATFSTGGNAHIWQVGNGEVMRLDYAGNLGLGVTPSAWSSSVNAMQLGFNSSIASRTGGSGTYLSSNAYFSGDPSNTASNGVYVGNTLASTYLQTGGIHAWFTAPSGTAGAAISFTQAMTLDASGNVGIGTSEPRARTHLTGTGQTTANLTDAGSRDSMLRVSHIDTAAGSGGAVLFSSNQGDTANSLGFAAIKGLLTNGNINTTGDLAFSTRATTSATSLSEAMRIDSSGNLLVGTTTNLGGKLMVSSDSAGASYPAVFNNTDSGSSLQIVVDILRNSTRTGYIANTNNTTSYVSASDYRLKENVQPMAGALTKVQALKPVTYKWKTDGSDGQGFIAHELQEIVPDCVSGEKDAVDADGKPKYQGVDTSFLVGILTAALQELSAKLDAQQVEINLLKGN